MAFNDEMSTPPVGGAASDPAAAAAAELRQAGMPEHDIIKTLLAKGFQPQEILAATGGGVASADATAGIEQPAPDESVDLGVEIPANGGMSPAGTPNRPPPLSVRDAVSRETDPTAGMKDELSAAPASPRPEVGVGELLPEVPATPATPGNSKLAESPGTLGKILGLLSPDSAFGQGLMAAGFGALGARGTYGNTGAALGQGGLFGVGAYQSAVKEQRLGDAAKAKVAEDLHAQQLKRVEAKLGMIQKLSDNQPEAANRLMKDPEVQAYLNGLGTGVVFTGKQDKRVSHFNSQTGQLVVYDPNSDSSRLVGQYAAAPRAAGDSGAYNQEIINDPQSPNYDSAYPVGALIAGRFDRGARRIGTSGSVPEKGTTEITYDENGRPVVTIGKKSGGGVPAATVTKAEDDLKSAASLRGYVGELKNAVTQDNIGIWGKIKDAKFGALATLSGSSPTAKTIVDTVTNMRNSLSPEDAKMVPGLYDDKLAAVQVYANALAVKMARAQHGSGNLGQKEIDNYKTMLGLDNANIVSADQVQARLNNFEKMIMTNEQSAIGIIKSAKVPLPKGYEQYEDAAPAPGSPRVQEAGSRAPGSAPATGPARDAPPLKVRNAQLMKLQRDGKITAEQRFDTLAGEGYSTAGK